VCSSDLEEENGIVRGTSAVISHFYLTPDNGREIEHSRVDSNSLPDFSHLNKIELEAGAAYKLRIAAVNAVGRGPWSDVSAFKTCLPGFPGAPSSIRITKSNEGAHLSWEPPQFTPGDIVEYSVYLAVKPTQGTTTPPSGASQLVFVRVYCGKGTSCNVFNANLASAHIDTTTKPAIIFRIAAKNEKGKFYLHRILLLITSCNTFENTGYGPATQVRWLQDSSAATTPSKSAPKRSSQSDS
jgi:host cell factor